jgi:hypothetical protein
VLLHRSLGSLTAINADLKAAGLKEIVPSTEEPKRAPAAR